MPVDTAKSAMTRRVCGQLFDGIRTLLITSIDGGADIRYVGEMLGHAKLETTQIYTRVSIAKLRAVHAACHPAGDGRPDTAEDHLRAV